MSVAIPVLPADGQEVADVAASAEPGFLALSQHLGELAASARELRQATESSGESLRQALERVRPADSDSVTGAALEAIDRGLETVRSEVDELRAIARVLQPLNDKGRKLLAVAEQVKVIGCAFAVESARSESVRGTFASFVAELRALGDRVGESARDIDAQSRHLIGELARMVQSMESALNELARLRAEAGPTVQRTLSRVRLMFDHSLAAAAHAEKETRAIGEQTEKALFYLQFGDIIRQKLEHVAGTLSEARASAPEQLPDVFAVQAGQLRAVCGELTQAHQQLDQTFAHLAADIQALAATIATLSGAPGAGDAIGELRDNIASLVALEVRRRRLCGEARQHSDRAIGLFGTLSAHLDTIRPINEWMQLQALNATIKTYALRTEARALPVLTSEIRSISKESGDLVNGLVEILTELRTTVSGRSSGRVADSTLDAAALDGTLHSFFELEAEIRTARERAAQLARRQDERVRQARHRLLFMPRAAERLSHVALQLEAECGRSGPRAAAPAAGGDRYTMESERRIHRLAVEGGAPAQHEPLPAPAPDNDNMEFF